MARTKTESTSLDHAEASPPSKKYEPSPIEREILQKDIDRHERNPAPRLNVTYDDGIANIGHNHPDPHVGGVLAMNAIGTSSGSFYKGILSQLVELCPLAGNAGSIDEKELNATLSMVYGVRPRDEVEGMLACQMAALHLATMRAAKLLSKVKAIEQQDSASRMLNQCSRTFAALVESLKKYRSTGEQIVKVQHVNVGNGGQAVITDTLTGGEGRGGKNGH